MRKKSRKILGLLLLFLTYSLVMILELNSVSEVQCKEVIIIGDK